jgi:hypothetical protein
MESTVPERNFFLSSVICWELSTPISEMMNTYAAEMHKLGNLQHYTTVLIYTLNKLFISS